MRKCQRAEERRAIGLMHHSSFLEKQVPGVGSGVICVTWAPPAALSFPRRRESTLQAIENAPPKGWIPAFAGMTGVSNGIPIANDTSTQVSGASPPCSPRLDAAGGRVGLQPRGYKA